MPLLADRVRETTTTTGTGTLALGGAVTGYQSFNTAFANGAQVYYVIQFGAEWELGIGTVGPGTLSRDTVLESSNLDAFVPFSVGLKDVFVSYLASRAVTTSDAATLTNKTIDDYTNNVGANSTHFRIKATGTIAKGAVVKATGYNPGESAIEVAVVTSATDLALGICEQPLTAGQFGLAVVIGELFDVNTNGLTVNGILYSNGSGGFTQTKPSSGTYQPLGWVVRANTNNGVIAVNIVAPLYVEASTNTANTLVLRDGSGNFSAGTVTAALAGNATTATTADKVANALTAGTYLTSGGTFDGAAARTFAVDATSSNTASKVVARDASGDFSAGTITANLTGNISGTAPAGTLTGTTLASNVVSSSLTSVGTLSSLMVGGDLTVDTSTLKVDSTNNRVGIGTASPGALLEMQGAGSATEVRLRSTDTTSAQIRAYVNSLEAGKLEFTSARALNIETAGSLRASIDGSGNFAVDTNTLYVDAANNRVGVGTASPATALQVYDATSATARITSGTSANLDLTANATDVRVGSPNGVPLLFRTSGVTQATLDASGNLGLGVTPSTIGGGLRSFEIGKQGTAFFANPTTGGLNVVANAIFDGTNYVYVAASPATRYLQSTSAGSHSWFTAASGSAGATIAEFTTAKMVLDVNGNLGVGTTNPQSKLHVYGAAATTLRVDNGDNAAAQTIALATGGVNRATLSIATSSSDLVIKSEDAGGRSNGIQFWTGNASAERMTLAANGNLGIGTPSPSHNLHVIGSTTGRIQVEGNSGFGMVFVQGSSGESAQLQLNSNGGSGRRYAAVSTSAGVFAIADETASANRVTIDANGNLAVDTSTLYVDAANNRVGVGTASPSTAVDVYANANAQNVVLCRNADTNTANYDTQVYYRLDVAGNHIGGLKSTAKNLAGLSTPALFLTTAGAYPIAFGINSSATPSMVLDASGNLGLGVTPSAWDTSIFRTIQIGSGAGSVSLSGRSDSAKDMVLGSNVYYASGSFRYVATSTATAYRTDGATHAWLTAPSGTAGNAITFTQAMTLDASGNFGVGTASPTFGAGTGVEIERAGIATLRLQNTSNANAFEIQTDSAANGVLLRGYNASPLVFYTNNTERAQITSGGNFGIGTASPDAILTLYNTTGTTNGINIKRDGWNTTFRLGAQGTSGDEFWITNNYNPNTGAADAAVAGYINIATQNETRFYINTNVRAKFDNPSVAGQTALLLYDVDNGTLERVTVGAADSGGTGFKVLRIPN